MGQEFEAGPAENSSVPGSYGAEGTKREGLLGNRRNIIIAAGCLVAILMICACSGAGFWYLFIRQPQHLNARLSIPAEAIVGEEFVMQVTASNPHGKSVTLNTIDIDDAFLVGFQVTETNPESILTESLPIFDQRSWVFDVPISPDEENVFTFDMRPLEAGRYSGHVEVCDSALFCTRLFADVVVVNRE